MLPRQLPVPTARAGKAVLIALRGLRVSTSSEPDTLLITRPQLPVWVRYDGCRGNFRKGEAQMRVGRQPGGVFYQIGAARQGRLNFRRTDKSQTQNFPSLSSPRHNPRRTKKTSTAPPPAISPLLIRNVRGFFKHIRRRVCYDPDGVCIT
jgi:hypothetical protein